MYKYVTLRSLGIRVKCKKNIRCNLRDMSYLVFDTETTGKLPKNYKQIKPYHTGLYPHLVQIGWVKVSKKVAKKKYYSAIIKPENFTIPRESTNIHGITHNQALAEGKPLSDVLKDFIKELEDVDYLVAHNGDFDARVIASECYRLKLNDIMKNKTIYCTMKTTTNLCKLKGKYGYKYPKVSELYHFLFRKEPQAQLHNALEDAIITEKCFSKLTKRFSDIKWEKSYT